MDEIEDEILHSTIKRKAYRDWRLIRSPTAGDISPPKFKLDKFLRPKKCHLHSYYKLNHKQRVLTWVHMQLCIVITRNKVNLQSNNGWAEVSTRNATPRTEISILNIIPVQQHISHIAKWSLDGHQSFAYHNHLHKIIEVSPF